MLYAFAQSMVRVYGKLQAYSFLTVYHSDAASPSARHADHACHCASAWIASNRGGPRVAAPAWMRVGETPTPDCYHYNRYGIQLGVKIHLWGGFSGHGRFTLREWTPQASPPSLP